MFNENAPTVHVSITRRVNLGNFESLEITLGYSRVSWEASEDDIASAFQMGSHLLDKAQSEMRAKVAVARSEHALDLKDWQDATEPGMEGYR